MFSFKKFLFENATSKKRKYVSIQYDNKTQNELRRWAEWNGFDLTATFNGGQQPAESFDFHTTIFYTTSRHDTETGIIEVTPKTVKPIGFKMLGRDEDVPVLSLALDNIEGIRRHYEEMGFKDEWPYYQPHISVSYSKKLPIIEDIALPEFDITFDRIVIKDILDNQT